MDTRIKEAGTQFHKILGVKIQMLIKKNLDEGSKESDKFYT